MYTDEITYSMNPFLEEHGYPVDEFGDIYTSPTYAEVLDWLKEEKGIDIILNPFFTYALKNHTAYTWEIKYIKDDKIVSIEETYVSGPYGGSFNPTMDAAIKYALENLC